MRASAEQRKSDNAVDKVDSGEGRAGTTLLASLRARVAPTAPNRAVAENAREDLTSDENCQLTWQF
jgi:hypothetical protein